MKKVELICSSQADDQAFRKTPHQIACHQASSTAYDTINPIGKNRGMTQRHITLLSMAIFGIALMIVPPKISFAQVTATAQASQSSPQTNQTMTFDATNPISILQNASRALPIDKSDILPNEESIGLSATLSILLLLTVLTVAPSLLVLTTSFTRIVIVLALLRQAIGTQSLPPSQVVVGLAMFMTFLVMAPTFDRINQEALTPLQNNQIDQIAAWSRAKQPLRDFMFDQISYAESWADVYMVLNYRGIDTSKPDELTRANIDMLTLIPSFILSELKVAFLMGFRLYLPFLIIDMVVASVLISMGMLMLPPVLISLPFKLLMFVLVDGWQLVVGNLLNSFAVPGVTT